MLCGLHHLDFIGEFIVGFSDRLRGTGMASAHFAWDLSAIVPQCDGVPSG